MLQVIVPQKEQEQPSLQNIVVASTIKKPQPLQSIMDPQVPIAPSKIDDERFDYTPASVQKAEEYRNAHSYKRKLVNGQYQRIPFCAPNESLMQFGVGLYLYIQMFRRLAYLFLFITLAQVTPMVLNILGGGFSQYSLSFGNYFIKTTLGNYDRQQTTSDAYVQTGIHCFVALSFFIFMITWKGHSYRQRAIFEKDNNIIHPKKYCVEIEGLPKYNVKPEEVKQVMERFGPVYDVCIVRGFKDKLSYFHELDDLDQELKELKLEQEAKLGGKKIQKKIQKLREKRKDLIETIEHLQFQPKIKYCYVHFQYQASRQKMLDYYNQHWMFASKLHRMTSCMCSCCIKKPDPSHLFRGETKLRIRSDTVPDPEEINWESVNITKKSKFFRILLAIFVILLLLGICSILVAICSIFISANTSSCSDYNNVSFQDAVASTDPKEKECYCNSNLFLFYKEEVWNLCVGFFAAIYKYNGLQILAALTSTIMNQFFNFMVNLLVDFTKPSSHSNALITKSLLLFIFLFLNSCILPVLVFSQFGSFQLASYISLLNINLDFSNVTFFNDFQKDWYRVVSPYFTNFILIDIVLVWLKFVYEVIYSSCVVCLARRKEGKVTQKSMNKQIAGYEIDVVSSLSSTYLIIFMTLMYNAGVPILVPLCLVDLLSRYITYKGLVLGFSSRIQGMTDIINSISYYVLPFACLISCLVGTWMFTASSQFYPDKIAARIPFSSSVQNSAFVLPRIFYLSYTFVLACCVFCYIFLENTIVRFVMWLVSLCWCSKKQKYEVNQEEDTRKFSDASLFLNILCSYDIHQNDKYRNAVHAMEKWLLKRVHTP